MAEQLPPFAVVEALLGHRSAAVDGLRVLLPTGAYKVSEEVCEKLLATEMAGATRDARLSGKRRGGRLAGEERVLDRECNVMRKLILAWRLAIVVMDKHAAGRPRVAAHQFQQGVDSCSVLAAGLSSAWLDVHIREKLGVLGPDNTYKY